MITIPGSNISIPAGIQIPTSQAISIPNSSGVQVPVASVASVASVANAGLQLSAGDKGGKDQKAPTSPGGQGWF